MCHGVSGDKNIDWQLADDKGESSFGILNKMTTAPTRTLIGKGYEPTADEKEAMQALRTRRTKTPRLKTLKARPTVFCDPKKAGCGI